MVTLPGSLDIVRSPAVTVRVTVWTSEQEPVVASPTFAMQLSPENANAAAAKITSEAAPPRGSGCRRRSTVVGSLTVNAVTEMLPLASAVAVIAASAVATGPGRAHGGRLL